MKKTTIIILFILIAQYSFCQKTILWKITDTINNKTSTILGTYHQFGNSFVDSIPELKENLFKSDIAVFEAIDDNGETTKRINNRASSDIKKKLKKKTYLELLEISEEWKSNLHKLKPIELRWKLQQEYVKLKCNTIQKKDKWHHFDNYLQFLAKEKGIDLYGLETYKKQLEFISKENNYPNWKKERKAIRYLIKELKNSAYDQKKCELAIKYRMYDLDYKFKEECKTGVLIKERNQNWMKILPKMLRERNCFIAVGLFHLYNRCGLLEQLKKEGFIVEPIELKPADNKLNKK